MIWDDLKDKHKGGTCIVIGNGPSLKSVSRDFIGSYPSFGTNRIFLRGAPTYYVCVNPLVFAADVDKILGISSDLIFLPNSFGVEGDKVVPMKMTGDRIFGDPISGFYEGWTVTFVCLELASWMGFKTVLLVGVDHKYDLPEGVQGGDVVRSNGPDPNHFSEDYFGPGYEYHAPDLRKSEYAYRLAFSHFQRNGGRVLNLTEGTALNIFPRMTIEEWEGTNDDES